MTSRQYNHKASLDQGRAAAVARARKGECDGGCELNDSCSGNTKAVRVAQPHGTDWGWFSYCATAYHEDLRRGLFFPDESH